MSATQLLAASAQTLEDDAALDRVYMALEGYRGENEVTLRWEDLSSLYNQRIRVAEEQLEDLKWVERLLEQMKALFLTFKPLRDLFFEHEKTLMSRALKRAPTDAGQASQIG